MSFMRFIPMFAVVLSGCVASQRPVDVTVMTFNVRMGCGHDDPFVLAKGSFGYLPKCAEVIRRENPDFVAIQEIDCCTERAGGIDQTAVLAQLCGLYGTFVPKVPMKGGDYGLAILSREKPQRVDKVLIPGKVHTRCLMICEFEDYIVANTHFPLSEEKCETAASIVCRELYGRDKPVVLMGDFNSKPNSRAMEILGEMFEVVSDPSAPTWPAKAPRDVIDYVMVDRRHVGSFKIGKPRVVSAPDATDHCALVLTLGSDKEGGKWRE